MAHARATRIMASMLLTGMLMTGGGVAGQAQAEDVHLIRVSVVPFLSYAPFFIGVEEGYFAKEGLELEFVRFRLQGDDLPALSQRQIDVSGGAISAAFFNAVGRGMNLKIVADRGHTTRESRYIGWVVRRELYETGEVRTVADLKGRRIAIGGIGGGTHRALGILLEQAGLSYDDVELVQLGYPETVDALATGAVDATGFVEPLLTISQDQGVTAVLVYPGAFLPESQDVVIYFGPSLLEDEPEIGRRFLRAYLRSVNAYNQGKTDRNVDIIHTYTELDRDLLLRCAWPIITGTGRVNVSSVLDYQTWLYQNGFVDRELPAEQILDMSLVGWANENLGGAAREP